MSPDLKVLRKEGVPFRLDEIHRFISGAGAETHAYSLRAKVRRATVGGQERTVYLLFLRDGTESLPERFSNWLHAKQQRLTAKQLVSMAISARCRGNGPLMAQDRAGMRLQREERMAPGMLLGVLSALDAGLKERDAFLARIGAFSTAQRQSFSSFPQALAAELSEPSGLPRAIACAADPGRDARLENLLSESAFHYSRCLLQQFRQFAAAMPAGAAPTDIQLRVDLSLVLDFCRRWQALSSQSGAALHAAGNLLHLLQRQLDPPARHIVDELVAICTGDAVAVAGTGAPSAASQALISRPPRPSPPPARDTPLRSLSASPQVLADMFQSFWAWRAGRHAMAVQAASRLLVPRAQAIAGAASPPSSLPATPPPSPVRRTRPPAPRMMTIPPACSARDIACDWQSELDLADMDPAAVLLVRETPGPLAMSRRCEQWLAGLQRRSDTHFGRAQQNGQEIWLAPHQAASLNQPLSSQQLDRLAALYAAAVDEAVSNDKPICLTALFDYDERTVDRCVDAMLSPVGKWLRAGVRPAIHIRVTSARLREKILLALENLPYAAASLSARPDLEVTDRLEEEDLKLPGMMMVTARTAGFATGALGRRLARLYANSREPGMDRVCPRRLLSGQNRSHFYFFASPCPLKDGYPDGAGLAGEYGTLFAAARQRGCQLVSIEVLSEGAGHDAMLAAGLAAAILSARAQTPGLKVRVLSRSAVIRDMLTERF